jgi:outer membrane protein assembly factor BamA
LQLQQGESFYRLNATGKYFFNYPKGGGMHVRLFAAKFGYIGVVSSSEKFETQRYQPNLTAVRGDEDYTYSDYFIGRNNFDGFASRQVIMRDGGLMLRTDLFQDLQGRSDNWIASVNLNTTLPKLLPVAIPLRVFFDAGTYAEAWKSENPDSRFLYVAGLQLSMFKELLNIYAPILYSKQFADRLKTVPDENKFFKRVSFSIDVQRIGKIVGVGEK